MLSSAAKTLNLYFFYILDLQKISINLDPHSLYPSLLHLLQPLSFLVMISFKAYDPLTVRWFSRFYIGRFANLRR